MDNKRVSVVVTNWNGKELLEKNLPQIILASQNPKNKIDEIIVVDDASVDDSEEFVRKSFPQIRIVVQEKNFGYSATCNKGINEAKNEIVAVLNNDVSPSKNFLENCLTDFNDNQVFSVSFNEGNYGPGRIIWKDGFLQIEATRPETKTALTDWPSGGTSVFRRSIWQQLKGMDEIYLPFYWEDVDLGLRAKKAGFKCLWEPKSIVIHQHESTINSKSFEVKYLNSIKQRNQLLLTWKNIDGINRFFSHFWFLKKRILLNPGYVRIFCLAFVRMTKYSFSKIFR